MLVTGTIWDLKRGKKSHGIKVGTLSFTIEDHTLHSTETLELGGFGMMVRIAPLSR